MRIKTSQLAGAAALATLLGLALYWGWQGGPTSANNGKAQQPAVTPTVVDAKGNAGSAWASLPKDATPEETSRWISEKSALAGTEMDGSWGVDKNGALRPSRALRQRFDYFLQLLGQMPVPAISAQVESQARRELPPAATAAVMDVWKRYLDLQQTQYSTSARPNDPASVRAALVEQSAARKRILGPEWAAAFYGDEEATLRQDLERLGKAAPVTSPEVVNRIDPATLDAAGAARLAAEQAAQARWREQLEATRREVKAIRANPTLDEAQRRQAIDRLIEERYPKDVDRLRVRGLVDAQG